MEDEELETVPALRTPTIEMSEDEVEQTEFSYTDRSPDDWVLSGPVTELLGRGPGRRFESVKEAWRWAKEKYGPRLRGRIREAEEFGGRWAFVIRGRGANGSES